MFYRAHPERPRPHLRGHGRRIPVSAAAAVDALPSETLPSDALPSEAVETVEAIKQRLERESARELRAAQVALLRDLMPIIDDFDRTLSDARRERSSEDPLLSGVEMIRDALEKLLAKHELTPIDAVGCVFDPALHEALGLVQVDDPDEDGRVYDQWQRGYTHGGRVVRPARVRVARFVR